MASVEELRAAHGAAEDALAEYLLGVQLSHEAGGVPSVRAWTTQEWARLRELTEVARRAWMELARVQAEAERCGGEPPPQ